MNKKTVIDLFSAPSTAAAVILARRANGWIEWNNKEGNISSIGDGGDLVINRHTWSSGTSASSRLSGYIDEVRFSKIARYSGNFTPETKQLQNDENTLLLLNFENTTSNQVIDSSSNQNHGIINGTVNYVLRNDIEDSNATN